MVPLSAAGASLLDEIVEIALMPGGPAERARALLEPLRRITPCDAVLITAFDPELKTQTPLLKDGYSDAMSRALDGPRFAEDAEAAGLHSPRPHLRVMDLSAPPEALPTWSQHLYPAGIREGLRTGLFTRDGRYVGVVNTCSADPRPATEEARALLGHAGPWIAHAIDPLRTVNAIAALVSDAVAGVALTRTGNTVSLTGLPGHPILVPGSSLIMAAAARVPTENPLTTFLCPAAGSETELFRVSILTCPPEPPGYLRQVVLLSPAPYPYGLTRDQLRVLGMLVEGWPPARMAAALKIDHLVLADHIDDIVTKLRATSYHLAAARALRRGFYIPAALLSAATSERG
ncbi:GAF domain-containing protein [Actinoplanes sp. NPDC051346]|uniref:GAF domain-containing protein n=1 Tax=Actinoplanes sp. NPDC051346 TaxID=3155048 RepID=UPI0034367413